MKTHVIVSWICLTISCIVAIVGTVLLVIMGTIIHNEIESQIPLSPGSYSYKNWINPPVPVYMQFWFFDVTNGDEVQKNGTKPILVQHGPYTYQEHRVKSDIQFHDNGTVSYREAKSYVFVKDMSSGSEEDVIRNVNLGLVGLSQMLGDNHPLINSLLSAYFSAYDGSNLFPSHTVHEWLWGFNDPGIREIEKILHELNVSLPIPLPDKIGLYYNKNGTDDGVYTIYNGKKGVSNFSVIDLWKGEPTLNYWTTEIANAINGTDGTSFPPFVKQSDKLYIFSSELCRSIDVIFQKKITLKGIDLYRFSPPATLFGNATENPDNAGFCSGHCLDSGVLNLSICQSGQPVIMSEPHFFQAAKKYLNAVVGLHPSAELATHIDVDPITGVVLNAAKKLQINIDVHPVKNFTLLDNVNLFLPFVWINESATVDDKSAKEFKRKVTDLIEMATILKYAVFIVGMVFLLTMIIIVIVVMRRSTAEHSISEDEEQIINDENTPESDQA